MGWKRAATARFRKPGHIALLPIEEGVQLKPKRLCS